jgi:DNA-binding CsgD family transcriptional regulator/catechol 2,3-dioxygenase-like lactoylglutathione lyase family enzyme
MTGNRGRPPHPDVLTPAEWGVVEAVRHGMTSRQIARRRGISPDAVKFHMANILQKLGMSGRAELRRWTGVRNDSARHAQETTMQDFTLGPVGQVSRNVGDIAAATAWYRDVLGLPHLYSFGELAFFDCDGLRLYLQQSEGDPAGESVLYFRVSDIRAAHAALEDRGAVFTNAPHLIHRHPDGTEEWMAFFNDPEGRPLAIMSQVKGKSS